MTVRLVRPVVWLVVFGVLGVQLYRYAVGGLFYGEILHWTGLGSVLWLLLALAATPLRRIFPGFSWSSALLRVRRDLGIATFVYAASHTLVYLFHKRDLELIAKDSLTWGMLTGWLSFLIFLPLAITSNNYSVRRLGNRWKNLHRLVYAGTVLALAHWIGTAYDLTTAYVCLAIVAVLLAARVRRT